MRKLAWFGGTVVLIGVGSAAVVYAKWNEFVPLAAMGVNYVRYWSAPAGTLTVETSAGSAQAAPPTASAAQTPASPPPSAGAAPPQPADNDWPSYNRTLTSERFSPLVQITRENAASLQVLCDYDTGQHTGFTSGILAIGGNLIFTTEYDIFSIDGNNCHENWRVHEDYAPATPQGVSRGPAYLDGKLFRGTQDGRVLAYDVKTGQRLWQAVIADPKKGESVPAAPIAWNGMVFVGNAGGDIKGVKGRMYALDAASGKILWEFYLVPRAQGDVERGPEGKSPLDGSTWQTPGGSPVTGGATWTSYTLDPSSGLLYVPGGNPAPDFAVAARGGSNLYSGSIVVLDAKTGDYRAHIKLVPKDWHDWDVSGAPSIIQTQGGKKLLLEAPKDGHLYAFDLAGLQQLYRVPVTKMENTDIPFEPGKQVHFCPGSTGGAEWNGPAYDPQTNLIFIGEVQFCTTVTVQPANQVVQTASGAPWSGEDSLNPYNVWGKQDPFGDWAGWVYAVDADTGQWRWRAKSNYPVQSGMTPTAGGVVFFGDMGGNFYALDTATGRKLWSRQMDGAVGGGVIAYNAGNAERVAVATGLIEVLWPTRITTAKVSILGLGSSLAAR